jgi:hypothetical protein
VSFPNINISSGMAFPPHCFLQSMVGFHCNLKELYAFLYFYQQMDRLSMTVPVYHVAKQRFDGLTLAGPIVIPKVAALEQKMPYCIEP